MGFKHFMSTSHIDIYLICKYLNILNVKVGIPSDTFKKPDTSDDTVAESLMSMEHDVMRVSVLCLLQSSYFLNLVSSRHLRMIKVEDNDINIRIGTEIGRHGSQTSQSCRGAGR